MSAPSETSELPAEPLRSLAAMPDSGIGCQHLKTWPEYFDAVDRGIKTFEIRQNDRPFTVGTKLILHEYDPGKDSFTGRTLERVVTYMTDWEQKQGFVVMAIKPF